MEEIKKVLIIRFRQIGDSVLTTALCSTIKRNFPTAEIHYILNKGIAPLYENHPDIDKVITFDKKENKSPLCYIKKVWKIVHQNDYDVIIDIRSTFKTLFFSLFSLNSPFRIGRDRGYVKYFFNYRIKSYSENPTVDVVHHDLQFVSPLEKIKPIKYISDFKIYLTEKEKKEFRNYMEKEGIDFNLPILLIGVTTKLAHKKWNTEYMVNILKTILEKHENIQMIFNYAPGYEEEDARNVYKKLGCSERIKINIQASSLRQLAALCANCSFYFGNEGGTRHIAQAVGIGSFAIFSPSASKLMWLPSNSIFAEGISVDDVLSQEQQTGMTYEQRFNAITPEEVYKRLKPIITELTSNHEIKTQDRN